MMESELRDLWGKKLNLQLDLITDLIGELKRYQYWTLKCLSYWKETINFSCTKFRKSLGDPRK